MAKNDELAKKVLAAVKGDNEAIKKLSDALVSRDTAKIKDMFSQVAGVQLSDEEAASIISELGSNPEEAVAYWT